MRINKKLLLITSMSLIAVTNFTGCYPSGEVNSSNIKSIDENPMIQSENNATDIKRDIAENLQVDARLNINLDKEWNDYNVILKQWNVAETLTLFIDEEQVLEKNEIQSSLEEQVDTYLTLSDGSALSFIGGDIIYHSQKEKECGYYSYLLGVMPYPTLETKEKFPECDIAGIDKQESIELARNLIEELEIEIDELEAVYSLTAELLEKNSDYSLVAPNGELPYQWTEDDGAYGIVFKGNMDGFPLTLMGYINASGPAAGTRISAIVGKEGLIAFRATNVYEISKRIEFEGDIVNIEKILTNIEEKYKNIILTNMITIDSISLEYVPVIENLAKGTYTLKPMYVCMANQEVPSEDYSKKEESSHKLSHISYFPIIFDGKTGTEIVGGIF